MDEFKCSICEKSYSSKDSQKRHEKDQHKQYKSFNCQDCGKQFSRKFTLPAHTNNIHQGVKFKCDQCDKEFKSAGSKYTHVKSIHEQKNSPARYVIIKQNKKVV